MEIQDCSSQLSAEMTKGTKKEFFFIAQLQLDTLHAFTLTFAV